MNRFGDRTGDETGAATVLAATFIAILALVSIAGIWLGSAVIARHRAQSAADLAALAAAAGMPTGTAAACGQAAALARAMAARVLACTAEQLDVTVVVSVPVGAVFGRHARASARAGPVTSD
ncbi:MAG: Rv3654c family TadE-like protein [Mycobacterium sp.]